MELSLHRSIELSDRLILRRDRKARCRFSITTRILLLGLLALSSACDDRGLGGDGGSNRVDEALLRPVLLDDRREMEDYLASLPPGAYAEYEVDSIGKFHLDDVDDVIKRTLRSGAVWEAQLVSLYPRYVRPGSVVIDAGAHIGTHTLALAKLVGESGRVYAFEPQRKLYRELVFNLRLNGISNVVPLRYALGLLPGVVEMAPAVRGNEGGTPVGAGGDPAEMRPLDSFGFTDVSLMKIDVEGFEDLVLEGARLTIARSRPVMIIEIRGGHSYESAPPRVRAQIEATRERLGRMGYETIQLVGHDYLATPDDGAVGSPADSIADVRPAPDRR